MNVREWALPLYTILMQLSVGALLVLWVIRGARMRRVPVLEVDRVIRNPILVIAFTTGMGMLSAHLHLSRPLLSFLAASNFDSSWLSREIVFTVLFFLSVGAVCLLSLSKAPHRVWMAAMGWLGSALGLTVVYCMANIYLLPSQAAWNSATTLYSFYAAVILLGAMTIACLLILDLKFAALQAPEQSHIHSEAVRGTLPALTIVAVLAIVADIAISFYEMHNLNQGNEAARTSLRLLLSLYMPLLVLRIILLVGAPVWLVYGVSQLHLGRLEPGQLALPVYVSCLAVLIAEILGRFLFYATHIRIGL